MVTYSLLLPLLLDHVGQNLGTGLSLSVQQVGWYCSLWRLIIALLFGVPLFMHLDAAKDTSHYCSTVSWVLMSCFSKPTREPAPLETNPTSPPVLTSSSSGSSLNVSACGTVWPSTQSAFWLCATARGPHGSPSSSSSHGGPGGSHAACGATRCARSGAKKDKQTYNLIQSWDEL